MIIKGLFLKIFLIEKTFHAKNKKRRISCLL